jgi:hypothetical protein
MSVKRPRPDNVRAGDTFLVAHPYNHLYVVCSEPEIDPTRVLIVSFTTFKPKEETCCIVAAGEHPFIKHKSCIRYKDARTPSVRDLMRLLDGSQMTRREPVSAELLARIRKGAGQSDYLPEECRRILQDQFLI